VTAATRTLIPDPDTIAEAAHCLRAGGLVAFPTETVYGLGANACDAEAVAGIFRAKGRPAHNPLIVHLADAAALDTVALDIPPAARRLAEQFWPGPLTLVLRRAAAVAPNVSGGRDTVAVRVPAHPVALALIAAAGVPVAAPSANRFGRPSATTAAHVLADLNGRIDLVLDAGPTPIGVESTVLDLTAAEPALLRPGGVTLEALRAILGDVTTAAALLPPDDAEAAPASPGMLSRHYSPEAPLLLYDGPFDAVTAALRAEALAQAAAGRRIGLLVPDEDRLLFADLPAVIVTPGPRADPAQIARGLFAALRALDAHGVDVILARQFPAKGLGLALADRLLRAASGRVIRILYEQKD
jgi:L-threonylcarbamoyladenylate synthase